MNQATQRSLVLAEGERAIECRLVIAAADAAAVAHQQLGAGQAIAAQDALRCANRMDLGEAFLADRKSGNVDQGSATETAIRRKENGKNAVKEGIESRNNHCTLWARVVSSFSL